MHIPVLLQEVLDGLQLHANDRCIDATVGLGGHAQALLEQTSPKGMVIGIDRDRSSLFLAAETLKEFGDRFIAVHDSYAHILQHDVVQQLQPFQGIVMDLGVSSYQLDTAKKGFAFRLDGPLDMRFNQDEQIPTAADILNQSAESRLQQIFSEYGEVQQSRRLAHAIVEQRSEQPFEYSSDLIELIERVMPYRKKRVHPATLVFQALRIEVNQELEQLKQFLPLAIDLLAPGGRCAIISFHSLEDRIVKHFFQKEAKECLCPPEIPECRCQHHARIQLITKKPIIPSEQEIANNPRSRSAKLRIVEKK